MAGEYIPTEPAVAELKLSISTPYDGVEPRQSYDLVIAVVENIIIEPEIFVFQAGVVPALRSGDQTDLFVSVADPVDMQEMPITTAAPNDGYPYYRKDSVTLRFRSVEELHEVKDMIVTDVKNLLHAVNSVTDNEVYEVLL